VTPDRKPLALVVASIAPYPPIGGGEKRTLRLLEAIQRCGADPYLIVTERPEDGAEEALRARGVQLELAPAPRPTPSQRLRQHAMRRPSPYLKGLARRLEALVAERRPAFVQFEHTQNAYYYRSVRGLSVVLSLHNVDSELIGTLAKAQRSGSLEWLRMHNRWHAMRVTERRGARAANAVLAVSDHDAASFDGIARRMLVVPNGVDEELFSIDGELPRTNSLLFFGKYDYEPNALGVARFLREVWPLVTTRHPGVHLRLVGKGLPDWLAAEAASSERVEVVGVVERIDVELARSSAVVVPIWHGAGTRLKVLESMAAARPIAGTPLGVSGVGFEPGRHGLVAESPSDLAVAVVTLLEDRDRAGRLAAEARRLAERFRWETVTEPAEQLYRDWVARLSREPAG